MDRLVVHAFTDELLAAQREQRPYNVQKARERLDGLRLAEVQSERGGKWAAQR